MENGLPEMQSNMPMEIQAGERGLIAREHAEIQSAIVSAKRYPRDESACYAKIIKSFERPKLAETAKYSFPRGGKSIEGPTVDLARECARCWGNIRYGLRIVSNDEDFVHIKGYATDLETNNYVECEDRLEKLVQRKNKQTGVTEWVKPDERDLRELINRRGAILVRNAILQIMPPDIIDDAYGKAGETMRKAIAGDLKQSKEETIRSLVLGFDKIGVTASMLANYLGHDLSILNDKEILDLRGTWKALHEGHMTREELFDMPNAAKPDLNNEIQNATGDKKKKKDEIPAAK